MSIAMTLLWSFMAFCFSPASQAPDKVSFAPMSKSHGIAQLSTQTQKIGARTRLVVSAYITQESSTPFSVSWNLPDGMQAIQEMTTQSFESHPGKTHEFAIDIENYYDNTDGIVSFEIKGTVNSQKMGSTAIFSNKEDQSLEKKMVEQSKSNKKRPVLQK